MTDNKNKCRFCLSTHKEKAELEDKIETLQAEKLARDVIIAGYESKIERMNKPHWVRVYDHEFNNGKNWGYTEKDSRVFRTEFLEVMATADGVYGRTK